MDNTHPNSLQFVSFASGPCPADLVELLEYLGYEIHPCSADVWLTSDDYFPGRSTVLFLTGSDNARERILLKLKEPMCRPCLGIFPGHERNWDLELLKCCDEFVGWPCHRDELAMRLKQLHPAAQQSMIRTAETRDLEEFVSLNMVGSSLPFLKVVNQIKKIARSTAPVLIEGETGTGKEMAARAIHYLGERRDYHFIPVNCGAIPDDLLENELFGHEEGAFTDAKNRQQGLIDLADHGTLFLDEVETFTPKGQVVLLRFLQDQRYQPLGSNKFRQADVRIITACNTNLNELVRHGEFRLDLYYRLYIIAIKMPPLYRRENDIWELTKHFLNKLRVQYDQPDKHLHPDSFKWMRRYRWPGNVRELENLLHREFLLSEGPVIKLGEIAARQVERRKNIMDRRQDFLLDGDFNEAKTRIVSQFEKNYLTRLLQESEGNVTLAAKRAGKERRALGKLLKKHGISKDGFRNT